MLSRVADSLYWMSRYIERAENMARFIDVNLQMSLDSPMTFSEQWEPLIDITGDSEIFEERYGKPTRENVIRFLTLDRENPNSIVSTVTNARENARSVREVISSDVWEQVNGFYLLVSTPGAERAAMSDSYRFFSDIKRYSHLTAGVADNTMSHGEPWNFMELGRMIERADKTTRILDIKYFLLLPDVSDVGTSVDDIHWAAVLRSAGAFEMYRKAYGKLTANSIVRFLLLDSEFPRSVRYCLSRMDRSLHTVTGTPDRSYRNSAERRLGKFLSELDYADETDIMRYGLHEYLDQLQVRINEVGDGIHDTFFETEPLKTAAAE